VVSQPIQAERDQVTLDDLRAAAAHVAESSEFDAGVESGGLGAFLAETLTTWDDDRGRAAAVIWAIAIGVMAEREHAARAAGSDPRLLPQV
jgi:hypothetical protein